MNRFTTMLGAGAVAMLLSVGAYAGEAAVTPAQIGAAKTPADHQAIAATYEKEAARLEEMAKEHDAMAKTYRAASAGKKGMYKASMSTHCQNLAKRYREAAEDNRAMAAEHRDMR